MLYLHWLVLVIILKRLNHILELPSEKNPIPFLARVAIRYRKDNIHSDQEYQGRLLERTANKKGEKFLYAAMLFNKKNRSQ